MSVTQSSLSPCDVLQDIESRSRGKALGLPQQLEVKRTWSGIGFRVGELLLVSSLGAISEILINISITKVPHAKSWVRGVANLRGTLAPVIDLKMFIEGGGAATKTRRSRTLVVSNDNLTVGLVVDEALGLRHFFDEERVGGISSLPDAYKQFVIGGYKQGNTQWGVFNMDKLVTHQQFLDVAVRI